jgi:hypothetical protein
MGNPTMRGCERFLVAAQSFVTAVFRAIDRASIRELGRSLQEKAEHDKDEAEPL